MNYDEAKGTPGRPRRHDRRVKPWWNCLCCGNGLDTARDYCGPTCRKRQQRIRDAAKHRARGGINRENRDS